MTQELVSLRDQRERTIALLGDLFAHDELDVDEFDRRVNLAHRAATPAELEALTAEFGRAATAELVPAANPIVPAASTREHQSLTAIFGGIVREGVWTSPRHLKIRTIMGGAQLDFREARLPAGVTEISIFALMGGVQIIVPPGLSVEVSGSAIMGGFDHMERSPPTPDPDRPVLSITGFAMMGGVHIETRLPGETDRDAHRRHRGERKALRRAARAERKQLAAPAAEPEPDK